MEVMKKQNLLLVLMLVFLPYASMFAFDFEVDGVCYNKLSDSEVEVTDKSDGYTGEVFIPSTISYNDVIYSVIGIGSKAFANSSARIRSGKDHKPNSVTISEGIKYIAGNAFVRCSKMLSISFPTSLTSIGNYAFQNCSGLLSISILGSSVSINEHAFKDCSALKSIYIPNSRESFSGNVFEGCDSVEYVNLNCEVIEPCFRGLKSLKEVVLGDNVKTISDGAFDGCSALTSVPLNRNVMSIGNSAFSGCYKLESISLSENLINIGDYTFSGCSQLTTVIIPNSVTHIGQGAFYGCVKLSSAILSQNITAIKDYTFSNCSLNSVTIPEKVDSIGDYAFQGCDFASVIVPNNVTYLGKGVFSACTNLSSVSISPNITEINDYTFSGCALTSVTIPKGVISIGYGAFYGCSNLNSIIIPESVQKIEGDAFSNTPWYENQPDGLIYLGLIAYKYKGSMPENTSLEIKDGTLGIAGSAFSNYDNLVSITIPESVINIGSYAFYYCNYLKSIIIPSGVTCIEDATFQNCINLESVSLPGIKSIGDNAFNNCVSLASVAFPDSLLTIGSNAFCYCGLTSVAVPDSVKAIAPSAFLYCFNLKDITIGNHVEKIEEYAFWNCTNLSSITILNGVPPIIKQKTFSSYTATLIVPMGCKDVYQNSEGWKNFTNIVENANVAFIIINEKNFPDVNFRNYLMSQEYGKDGIITNVEIAGIITLDVSNLGISDLKGIEYFTALKKLLCYKNNLTELNLSANKQLKDVDCYSNRIMGAKMDSLIASLPTLNEGEGSLYVLDATEEGNICFAEQVTSAKSKGWIVYHYTGSDWQEYEGRESGILISEENFPDEKFREYLIKQDYGKDMIITNDEIKTITSININAYNYSYDRAEGEIKSLKGIEHFTFLQSLLCNGNKLTNLDISMNSRLTTLSCLNNPLTEIDVSKNTELAELSCGGRFTRLDVSNNTKLITLHCESNGLTELDVSKNTALTSLSCHFTGLRSLDVSKNLALTSLSCLQNFSLTSIEISKNKALTRLSCPQNKLSEIDVSKNTALTYLFCPYNQLTNLDVSKNSELTELACMGNQLTRLDVSKNLKLKTLKCQQNKINGERMYQLIESLPIQPSASICVINLQVTDENVCTKNQVKKASEKGWKVMWGYEYYNSGPAGFHPHYYEYEGSDPLIQLTNGDFEIWEDGLPTGWKSASTASSATLTQSTDAHSGSYSVNVKGEESLNKRLASQEINLDADTYVFSFWVKPTTSDPAQVRPGYVTVVDGKAGNYKYGTYETLNSGWQQVSMEFTLEADATICLVVMNPKKSNYSSGKDVLIDDAMLTRKSSSGISTVTLDDRTRTGIYDLYGRRLNEPRKGINIIGGKKVVVK